MDQNLLNDDYENYRINKEGYYIINQKKRENNGKLLHRLFWENYYKKSIPKGYDIHHINGNKLNNNINNLQCVKHEIHTKYHTKNHWKNKEYLKKQYEIHHDIDYVLNQSKKSETFWKKSKQRTSSGIRYVTKQKSDNKQGFLYVYCYGQGKFKDKVRFYSKNKKKLENKAKYLNLPWIVLDSSKWECY